jgi:hypothetical protein
MKMQISVESTDALHLVDAYRHAYFADLDINPNLKAMLYRVLDALEEQVPVPAFPQDMALR